MPNFTAKDVMDLRGRTGCGMMDCKKALTECDGDVEKAIDYLKPMLIEGGGAKMWWA